MKHIEQWIWLPEKIYKNAQTTYYSPLSAKDNNNYTVAEFKRDYIFPQKITSASLRFSGDTSFQLFCNNSIVATGPACVGGDFIGNETARNNYYAFETVIKPNSNELNLFSRVQMAPLHICEYSKGHGGFMLSGIITFEDGTKEQISTDETWYARKNPRYNSPMSFDGRLTCDEFTNAEIIKNIWNSETAPIPVRDEYNVPLSDSKIKLMPYEEKTLVLNSEKIWGGFIQVDANVSNGDLYAEIICRENEETNEPEKLVFDNKEQYRGFYMHSMGNMLIHLKNNSDTLSTFEISFIATHYPVKETATTKTSNNELNVVLETCKHTLKICRQTHHLDSTSHCEPLACTGDYYIESLMTPFAFGDMRLAEFDLIRTAVMLERENGRMFHTTYSLIWVKMLYDVYMFTGNKELLRKCEKSLKLLLKLFETYIGKNGLIENPPDYMFIDWIYIDDITMHHPPKALGQTCLNMFYYGALESAENIYRELKNETEVQKCLSKRRNLRTAINSILFDSEKKCYFEGLNTPTKQERIGEFMPKNTDKKYYLKHSNILAAYFGVCDEKTGKDLIDRIISNEINGDCQPYFMHYLLEAVYHLGLRDKYTLKICELWKSPVLEFPKGLVEGFVAPEPNYRFDHSHAWGGTPLYSLPKALMGLEITKAGMKEIKLSPSLLGLHHAKAELLTPYGKIICEMSEGNNPKISYPKEIKLTLIDDALSCT